MAFCNHPKAFAADFRDERSCYLCLMTQLLTSAAVHRWGIDIQEGIFDMLQLLIDLIATRLRYEPVPADLLHVLAMVRSNHLFIDVIDMTVVSLCKRC